jgi:hypothetical protein
MGIWDIPPSPNLVFLVSNAQGISKEEAYNVIIDKQCPPSAAAQEIKAKAAALKDSWVTTGYYTGPEMRSALQAIQALLTQAQAVVERAYQLGADSSLRAAMDKFQDTWSRRYAEYSAKVVDALRADAILDAPSFKSFAIGFLEATYDLMRKAEYQVCIAPWWAGAIAAVAAAARAVYDVLKAIGRAVVAAGQAVIKAGSWIWEALPYLKWGGLGIALVFAGVFTYNKLVATAESGYKPVNWDRLLRIKKFSKPVAGYRRR